MIDFTQLEMEVMQMLLQGDDEILSILREQLEEASIENREMTGVGFYTMFKVANHVPRVVHPSQFKFGDVVAKMDCLNFGAGFLLYVRDGVLEMLEGYSYDEPWPSESIDFKLNYIPDGYRDLEILRKSWQQAK